MKTYENVKCDVNVRSKIKKPTILQFKQVSCQSLVKKSIYLEYWANDDLGLVKRNLYLGFVPRLEPAYSATEISKNVETLHIANLSYHKFQRANNIGTDQTARSHRLVCTPLLFAFIK